MKNQATNSKPPLVSIIIPVFNGEKYIGEAIESILLDDYPSKEIIVVNDGSTDHTAKIISAFDDLKIINQQNLGVSNARNAGIRFASGEFINYLDADDIWVPGRLANCLNFFDENPETDFVLGLQQMFLEKGAVKPPTIKQEWLENFTEASNNGVIMVRKTCYQKVGLFNTSLKNGEDTEWLLRARDAGLISARVPFVFIKRRIHDTNLTVSQSAEYKKMLFKIMRESVQRKTNSV
jgi:glycosyltransferase involved in cell wall biosynthesis